MKRLLLALLLAGCTAPLKPVSFDEPVAVTSDLRVAVALVSGAVRGASGSMLVPAGNILVPLSTGPNPQLQFNTDDQRAFVASFRSELERVKLVREALDVASASRADLGIQLIFAQTLHNGDSTWQKFNTNASEGKAKAASKLIKQLMPDVAAYIEQNRT